MLRGRDKDIDALRAGIREQEREAIFRERFEDIQARTYVRDPELRHAIDLKVGDKLVAASSGNLFYVDGEVTGVGQISANGQRVRPGYLWVTYKLESGGTGGSSWELDRRILMQPGRPSGG